MRLSAFQDHSVDDLGNPGIPINGCPNCGKVPEWCRGQRYLSGVGWAAASNSGLPDPNEPCSRACRLQWEYAEGIHQQPEARARP